MLLTLVSIEKQGCVRVAAEGRITAQDLMGGECDGNPLLGLLGPNWANHKIVLDFAQVAWVDSAAIGWLMTCNKACRNAKGTLVLHSVQPGVRQVFDMLQICKVLPVVEDEAAALASFPGQPAAKRARKSA